jgi:hypothetical protein
MGKPLVRFREGQEIQPGYGRDIVAPSQKQVATEKTNFFLQSRKAPVYSKAQIESFPYSFQGDILASCVHFRVRAKFPSGLISAWIPKLGVRLTPEPMRRILSHLVVDFS